jgi:sugar transferase (PEP-CTERM system associated)
MAKGLLQPVTWRSGTLILSESGLIIGAVAVSAIIALGGQTWHMVSAGQLLSKALLIAFICQLCLYYADLYDDPGLLSDSSRLLRRLLQSLGGAALILAVVYTLFPKLSIGPSVFMLSAGIVISSVVSWRLVFHWFSRRIGPRERLIIVGRNGTGLELARELRRQEGLAAEMVGFIDASADTGRFASDSLGTVDDIPAVVRARGIDRVIVSLSDARGKLPMDKLLEMKLQGVTFADVTTVYEDCTGKIAIENLRPSWLIFSPGFRKSAWLIATKRAVEVVLATIGLVLTLPVLLVLAAIIKLSSPGPALYSQLRVGQNGELFRVFKLRSMRQDAEKNTGAVWAVAGDPRVTRVGHLLRRSRLDEIPQLWNVLIGNMSLVGPRPERPEFVEALTKQIPFYSLRHVVKPGLTGWAQVRYTYGASVEDAMEKLQHDLFYIKNLTLGLDLFILFETVKTVVLHRGR